MKEIEYLKRRFSKDRIVINDADIDALNGVIEMLNTKQNETLRRNRLFSKFFIYLFMDETVRREKTAKAAIGELDRVLSIPMEDYYGKMRSVIPLVRFGMKTKMIGLKSQLEFVGDKIKVNSEDDCEIHNRPIIKKYRRELELALMSEYTQEELDKFIDSMLYKFQSDEKYLR